MKRYLYLLSSLLYIFPFQLNAIISGPEIALLLSAILIVLEKPTKTISLFVKDSYISGRLLFGCTVFLALYILAFFLHGGLYPNEPFTDSLIRLLRSLYPLLVLLIVPLHTFSLSRLIRVNLLNIILFSALLLSLTLILSLTGIFGCTTIYGSYCVLNQSSYSASGFISLYSILLLVFCFIAYAPLSSQTVPLVKSISLVSAIGYIYLLNAAGCRSAFITLLAFISTFLFLSIVLPVLTRFTTYRSYLYVFLLSLLVIGFSASSLPAEFSRAVGGAYRLLTNLDVVASNTRGSRYVNPLSLLDNTQTFFGSGNLAVQPNPLGVSWYDGAYLWFQNNYGLPGLLILIFLNLALFLFVYRLLKTLPASGSGYPRAQRIFAVAAVTTIPLANIGQEIFSLNSIAPFTLYIVCIISHLSLQSHLLSDNDR